MTEQQTKELILSLINVTTKLVAHCDVVPHSLREEVDKLYLFKALLEHEKEEEQ